MVICKRRRQAPYRKIPIDEKGRRKYNRRMSEKKTAGLEPEKMRINKYLAFHGVCSRREADVLIGEGRVRINGRAAVNGDRVSETDEVTLDEEPVRQADPPVILLFNKPRGVVCSTRRQRDETTVTEYLHYPVRIFPVGRLDKDSEGLLLLTNRGELSDRILRGSNYHEKEYRVTVDRPVTDDFLLRMASGVPILNTVTRPCKVERTGKKSFRIILTQGLNRQIRRMCEVLGYQVLDLKRVRILNLELGDLKDGEYREISRKEYEELKELTR